MTPRKLICLATALAWALSAIAAPVAYAGTPTTSYLFSKPTVSADADTWGTQVNADLDALDPILYGKCDLAGGIPVAPVGTTPGTAGCKFTGTPTFAVGTTTLAPFKFQAGTNLTSPAAGAVEWNGANLFVTQTSGPTRKQFAYIDDAITGSAAKWTTPRTITLTGNVTGVSGNFDGSSNLSFATTIPSATVTGAMLASGAATTNLGFTPANKAGDTFTGPVVFPAGATGSASFNIAPGVAKTSPVNGDCWLTTVEVDCRVGGTTLTLGSTTSTAVNSFNTRTGAITLTAADLDAALLSSSLGIGTSSPVKPLHIAAPTAAEIELEDLAGTTNHRSWNILSDGSGVNSTFTLRLLNDAGTVIELTGLTISGTTGVVSAPNGFAGALTGAVTGNVTGNASGTAGSLATGRTISLTGDVAYTSGSFDGSGNVTGSATIQAAAVTNADLANVATATIKGRSAAGTGAPSDLSATTARSVILPAMGTKAGQVLTVNSGGTDAAWSGYPVFASAYVTVSGTTPTVAANNNISGVVRTGTGAYTVSFNTTAPDANFALIVTGAVSSGSAQEVCQEDGTFTRTNSAVGVQCFNGGGNHDPQQFSVMVIAQ